jgi:DNA-binding Xre family transcriptional regulator
MPLNKSLKIKIIESGMRQVDVAKKTGIHEERLSHFVTGRRKPRQVEKTKIAAILDCCPDEIFNEEILYKNY